MLVHFATAALLTNIAILEWYSLRVLSPQLFGVSFIDINYLLNCEFIIFMTREIKIKITNLE